MATLGPHRPKKGWALRWTRQAAALCVAAPMAFVGTVLVISDIHNEAFWMPLAPEQMSDPTGVTLVTVVASFGLFDGLGRLIG